MELFITLIIATFCVAISCLFAPCTASNQVINVQNPLEKVHDSAKFALTSLPRKLKLSEHQATTSSTDEVRNFNPTTKKVIKPSSVTKQQEKEENVIHAAGKGTSNEKGPNKSSEYFTMDYVWIKKRRPIHNKQIPFVP